MREPAGSEPGRKRGAEATTDARQGEIAPTVIVVDRDLKAAEDLAARLGLCGITALVTARAYAALALVHRHRPRVVVVDASIRDMSGLTLAMILRDLMPTLRLVMTSGEPEPETERRAREIGVVHYTVKPVDETRLAALVSWIPGQRPGPGPV